MQLADIKPIREVTAATAGAAFGELVNAIAVSGVGYTWWPSAAVTILGTFAFGWFSHRGDHEQLAG